MLKLKAISKGCFQSNPDYQLLPLDSSSYPFSQLQTRSDFNIVVRSQNSGVAKLVCNETARLLTLFKKPGSVPVVFKDTTELDTTLARLVLDGILHIFWKDKFISGPKAWIALFEGHFPEQNKNCLSTTALRYAQALRLKDILQLAVRLYNYNCVPITHFWRKRFPDSEAVIRFLGISTTEKHLTQNQGWLVWRAKNWQWQRDRPLYKLYLSPQIIALQECWQKALPIFVESRAVGLKIGANAHGLLRPDKIVAHFENQEALMETSDKLGKALDGFPCQGVPFTAALDKIGLLSWGVDLPLASQVSWRSWLTYCLAKALIEASETDVPVEPWQYAMERIQLEGVRTQDWAPMPKLLQ